MKRTITKLLGGAFLALLFLVTSSAKAQTTLASWDFTKVYSKTSTDGTNAYYTATETTVSENGLDTNFSSETPFFYPASCVGTSTNYTISGGGSKWKIGAPYESLYSFQLSSNPINSLDDVTNASTHQTYYEISFPTTGYKDIKFNMNFSYSDNENAPVVFVVSIDGGSTWVKAGEITSPGSWWVSSEYNNNAIAVANQANVKLRILGRNTQTSKYWGIKTFSITGNAVTTESFSVVTAAADNASHGTATIAPAGGSYENGAAIALTATAKTGWKFKEWQIGGSAVSTDNPYNYTVSTNTALTAIFEAITTYTLTTNSSPAYTGKVTRSTYQSEYDENASITLTATPNIGYEFVEWQDGLGNQLSTENPYTFNITANTTAIAVFKGAVIAANTDVTIADWTFNTGYDKVGKVYTPNISSWEAVAQTQSKDSNTKIFNANVAYGALTNYEATVSIDGGGGTYYSIKDNNNDKVFSLYPTSTSNTISSDADYLDPAKHIVYYQFSFPTTGLKDITINLGFTHGSSAVKNLELVYSTDGGTTWVDAGACAGGSNWYTYPNVEKTLSADNQSNVIVRLLPANGETGDYRMDYFTVSGKIAAHSVTITDAKYATYYNSIPVQLPANLQAATIDNEASGTLMLNYRYGEGDVIPGGTAVLLKASAADTYTLTYVANDATAAPAGNLLYGSDVETTTTGGGSGAKYYALRYGTGAHASQLGFYWVNAEGVAFESPAHKAWLALPAAASPAPARFYSLEGGGKTTSIDEIRGKMEDVKGEYFNLAGQRVAQPTKGLYIVNGKKVIVR